MLRTCRRNLNLFDCYVTHALMYHYSALSEIVHLKAVTAANVLAMVNIYSAIIRCDDVIAISAS